MNHLHGFSKLVGSGYAATVHSVSIYVVRQTACWTGKNDQTTFFWNGIPKEL